MKKISMVKISFFVALAVVAIVLSINPFKLSTLPWVKIKSTNDQKNSEVSPHISSNVSKRAQDVNSSFTNKEDEAIPIIKQGGGEKNDAAVESAEIATWKRQRGRVDDQSEYYAYSKETLQKLVDANDMIAAHVLEKKMRDDYSLTPEVEVKLLTKAAILGSTIALNHLGISQGCVRYDAGSLEGRSCTLNQLAYMKAAALRGDATGYLFTLSQPDAMNLNITPEEGEAINNHAKEILSTLEQKRIQLGLGSFDNTIPAAVQKSNAIFEASIKNRGVKQVW